MSASPTLSVLRRKWIEHSARDAAELQNLIFGTHKGTLFDSARRKAW